MSLSFASGTAMRQSVPRRGEIIPRIDGIDSEGNGVSSRDYYMRRSLAIVFVGRDRISSDWIDATVEVAAAAAQEDGQVLLIAPRAAKPQGLPTVVDRDGHHREVFGLSLDDLPCLFITDRYGTLFVASCGEDSISDLSPRDIPRWLEFIACRCS